MPPREGGDCKSHKTEEICPEHFFSPFVWQ
jgi:hypothetical protein